LSSLQFVDTGGDSDRTILDEVSLSIY